MALYPYPLPLALTLALALALALTPSQALPADVVLSEYAGPRLHVAQLTKGEYALEVPASSTFVDGNYENSPFADGPRHAAIYANHSSRPNAKYEKHTVSRPGPLDRTPPLP